MNQKREWSIKWQLTIFQDVLSLPQVASPVPWEPAVVLVLHGAVDVHVGPRVRDPVEAADQGRWVRPRVGSGAARGMVIAAFGAAGQVATRASSLALLTDRPRWRF